MEDYLSTPSASPGGGDFGDTNGSSSSSSDDSRTSSDSSNSNDSGDLPALVGGRARDLEFFGEDALFVRAVMSFIAPETSGASINAQEDNLGAKALIETP